VAEIVWTPRDINRFIITATGALCLVIIVVFSLLLLMEGKIQLQDFGEWSESGKAVGIVGLVGMITAMLMWVTKKD